MSGTSEDRPARSPIRGWPAAILLIVGIALLGLWLARKPIANRFVAGELAARGVPARYTIADLGLGRQRLTDVVIGDPAHPDLVADWIETETGIGLSGPALAGVRAGHVRLRGRLAGGTVSLGSIDRLLPAPSGKPFALPALLVDVADARMRLETPQGLVGLKLSGRGRLDDGFAGHLAVVAPRLAQRDCAGEGVSAALAIDIARAAPHVVGPLRIAGVSCSGARVARFAGDIDLHLGAALDRWRGAARIATGAVRYPGVTLDASGGTLTLDGTRAATTGRIDLAGSRAATAQGTAGTVALVGDYGLGRATRFDGEVRVDGGAVAPAMLARAGGWGAAMAGTPIAPLAGRLAQAVARAGRALSGRGHVALSIVDGRRAATLTDATLASASGMRLALAGGDGIALGPAGVRIATQATLSGGGFPGARVTVTQAAPGAALRGAARIARYAAGDAVLDLAPVNFLRAPGGAMRIATTATLTGPLGGGRIDRLTLPLAASWDGGTRVVLDPACVPLAFDRLAVASLTLATTRLTLCPVDGALLTTSRGTIGGGATIGGARLAGRIGTTPLTLGFGGATVRLATRGFALTGVAVRLGAAGQQTRLDFASLDGRIANGAVTGAFAGGAGQIGVVPLLLDDAAGDWRFAGGTLALTGTLGVHDAQAAAPRFKPMLAKDVALGLADGRIAVTGTLYEPTRNRKVADLAIVHRLGSGTGSADLTVPGLAFDDAFQPDLLTPLTFGVIADVKGNVAGGGHIAWGPAGVTSTGTFRTGALDLAAAFGPVTGIATEIRFTDLLALQSAPGQIATIKTINPGIPVSDGTIRYQTLPDARISVESGRWPFAGGTLTLDPTLLDFAQPAERRMTFHVEHMAADQFLQQFDFKNLDASGIFDGVLPMIFDASGGRIEHGQLTVRAGGGTLAYVGDLSQKDLGTWANIAFQALKSLRYRSLQIVMNGPLAGEMITEVKFAGISQGKGAKSNFLIRRLQRLPFVFNIRIKAPFRGLLDSAQSFYDPRRLIQRNLPALLEQQDKAAARPIQPPASRTVP